jgi:nucleotide-binding universal stress UspA family protein
MFRKLLAGTDLTPASDAVLSCLGQLKPLGLEEVILTHVVYVAHSVGLAEALIEQAEPELARQKELLESQGLRVRAEVMAGMPAHKLADRAEEEDVSAIVIGSHSRSLLHGLLAGSVSLGVLGITTKPVLLVRMEVATAAEGKSCRLACAQLFRHILFPTDFSETAEQAFHYLQHVVGATRSRVTLLHVQDRSRLAPHLLSRLQEFNEIDAERLERLRDRLLQQGASGVDIKLEFGLPLPVILDSLGQEGFSLVVMGSQGRGFVSELTLGSVANGVARKAPRPVLFVPRPR